MEQTKDSLGDRLKAVEQVEAARRADKTKPLMARLDGKAFHTFTKGLARPYDKRLSDLMVDTARWLVLQTHARIGYVQSDEISLYWDLDLKAAPEAEYLYDGKFQKLTSILASTASAYFNRELSKRIPEKEHTLPNFDCRVWNVDDHREVYLNFLWRQDDAIKNSISMAAQADFSAKMLHGVKSQEKKEMLRAIGKPWESHPMFFKMGTFVGRVSREVQLTPEQLANIPEKHRPSGPVTRTFAEDLQLGYLPNESSEVRQRWFSVE